MAGRVSTRSARTSMTSVFSSLPDHIVGGSPVTLAASSPILSLDGPSSGVTVIWGVVMPPVTGGSAILAGSMLCDSQSMADNGALLSCAASVVAKAQIAPASGQRLVCFQRDRACYLLGWGGKVSREKDRADIGISDEPGACQYDQKQQRFNQTPHCPHLVLRFCLNLWSKCHLLMCLYMVFRARSRHSFINFSACCMPRRPGGLNICQMSRNTACTALLYWLG